MDLIIKPNTFNKDKIRFKYGKRCIKIIYDLDHLRMIGITLKIIPKKIIEDEHFLFLHIGDDNTILKEIDDYFHKKHNSYHRFIIDDIIKVKKHHKVNRNEVFITLNNLKKVDQKLKVQIFTI
ncbi:MAG: hypothetical protein CL470_00695 [Acidimicrobiaceae bacterium]|nr:hypothetical protein [Acidimicrobiaceae bacterium]